jgi:phosphatidylinositol dimannoside acyltransferase
VVHVSRDVATRPPGSEPMTRLWLLRLLAPLVGRAPRVFYPVAGLLAWLGWNLLPARRRALTHNMLPLCDGDVRRARKAARKAYRNVASYWVDVCRLPFLDLPRFERDQLEIENAERLRVLERPGPVIAISAHTGNAELAVQALLTRGRQFAALVERLEPPEFGRELLRRRSARGGRFFELGFAGLRESIEALRRGECLALMADRDVTRHGICVSLSGRQVMLPRGPWEIARRGGATVLPVLTARVRRDHFVAYVEDPFCVAKTADPEADIRAAVERWAGILERHLRRDPGQWSVLEDFWTVHACAAR